MMDNGSTDQVLRLKNTGSQLMVVDHHSSIGWWLTQHKLVLRSGFDLVEQCHRDLVLNCARHGRFSCFTKKEEKEDPYDELIYKIKTFC